MFRVTVVPVHKTELPTYPITGAAMGLGFTVTGVKHRLWQGAVKLEMVALKVPQQPSTVYPVNAKV